MDFRSPTVGRVTLNEMTEQIKEYIEEAPKDMYRIVVGTDSQTNQSSTCFVTALIIHRVGKGARFYFRKIKTKPVLNLSHRIYTETDFSLKVMEQLKQHGILNELSKWPIEVHLDIGKQGRTRKLIQEVVGWVNAVGFIPRIKPDAFGASSVADKFTKSG